MNYQKIKDYLQHQNNFTLFLMIFIMGNIVFDIRRIQDLRSISSLFISLIFGFFILKYLEKNYDDYKEVESERLNEVHHIIKRYYINPDIEENLSVVFNPKIYWQEFNGFLQEHPSFQELMEQMTSYQTINKQNIDALIYWSYTLILMKLNDNNFYKQNELDECPDYHQIYEMIKEYGTGVQLNFNCDKDVQDYLRILKNYLNYLKKIVF